MPTTFTQHFHFSIPDFDQTPWHSIMVSTLNLVDTVIYNALIAQNIREWLPSTLYHVGDPVIDNLTGLFWTCTSEHTSGSTFAADRLAHPDYWSINSASIRYEGEWISGTLYSVGQIVNIDYAFYACASSHTAGIFENDLATGNWQVIVDLNDAVAECRQNAARSRAAVLDMQRISRDRVLVSNVASQADAEAGTNNTRWMTPLRVWQAIAKYIAVNLDNLFWSTGDYKLTGKVTADTGWIMAVDGTVGSSSSGATYANTNALNLFTLYYTNNSDADCPIFTSTGTATTRAAQTNAAGAWAANCRISTPKMLSRAIGIAGAGSGLSTRTLGQIIGTETHALTATEQAHMNISGSASVSVSVSGTLTSGNLAMTRGSAFSGASGPFLIGGNTPEAAQNFTVTGGFSGSGSGGGSISGTATGGGTTGTAHTIMQPTSFAFQIMIKL